MKSAHFSRAPALFIGHGSPMNALADNEYTRMLRKLGAALDRPRAVLCVSAHWLSAGTMITSMPKPRTIHDFGGFPRALFETEYPAPGSVEVAELVRRTVTSVNVRRDDSAWGLDHGTWSVLLHLFPRADVPVLQLSLDMSESGHFHLELGRQLRPLRDAGVLILGSGNVSHNLRMLDLRPDATVVPWAAEFDAWVKERLLARDDAALAADFNATESGRLAVPTSDHFLPLLYAVGAADPGEAAWFEYEGMEHGSLSMRCVSFGRVASRATTAGIETAGD